ncbi:MAG: WbqC family protein [Treponema sp.]|jgi:hypothetical protein|nr:WbqC family protein [Treponema sp.]
MILSAHQPDFFPYMGFFYKIAKSDIFVILHDVKFTNKKNANMHNYNYIKGPQGMQKITLPVKYHSGALIKDVLVYHDKKHVRKLLTSIEQYYGKAPFFETVYPDILSMFHIDFNLLIDFNVCAIRHFCMKFGIKTRLEWSPGFTSKKNARLIDICNHFGADTYFSGTGAKAYIEPAEFERTGIKLIYSDYSPINYPQRYGDFIPNLSVLDYVFNMGYELPKGWLSCQK